jgi:hypothetical protein
MGCRGPFRPGLPRPRLPLGIVLRRVFNRTTRLIPGPSRAASGFRQICLSPHFCQAESASSDRPAILPKSGGSTALELRRWNRNLSICQESRPTRDTLEQRTSYTEQFHHCSVRLRVGCSVAVGLGSVALWPEGSTLEKTANSRLLELWPLDYGSLPF